MFQLPVNNLNSLRKARKKVKTVLGDIGLEYCRDHIQDFEEFAPNEFYVKNTSWEDVGLWDPSSTKLQNYRSKPFCCSWCPFSSKVFSAYHSHFRNVHSSYYESHILLNCPYCSYSSRKGALEVHVKLFHAGYSMLNQAMARQGAAGPLKDTGVARKPRPPEGAEQAMYYCKKCTYRDHLYNVVRKHIYREHFQHVATPYISRGPAERAAGPGRADTLHCKRCLFVPRTLEALVQHVIEDHERIGYQVTAMIGHATLARSGPLLPIAPKSSAAGQKGAVAGGAGQRVTVTGGAGQKGGATAGRSLTPQQLSRLVPVGAGLKPGLFSLKGGALQPLSSAPPQVRITLPGNTQGSVPLQSLSAKKLFEANGGVSKWLGLGASSSSSSSSSFSSSSLPSFRVAPSKAGGPAVNTAQTQKWKICTICNELFPENVYNAHFEKEHKAQKVRAVASYIVKIHNFTSKCLYCNRYLPSDTLLNHMLIHGLACPHCLSTFNDVERLVAHVRQTHPGEAAGGGGADSPLTFDLTMQHGEPRNVQLLVTTYCSSVRDASQDLAAFHAQADGKRAPSRGPEGPGDSQRAAVRHKKDAGKTLCPLCFSILKGPISDSLALHLRERHQVIQTVHPVEKKLTYKCIHCLGVYTSNMSASTITLHLVHCRGVGRAPADPHAPPLPGPLPLDPAPAKRRRTEEPGAVSTAPGDPAGLGLSSQARDGKSYEEAKAFLARYFNRQPYPSQREVEKLASALWLWKADVSRHFALRQRSCEQDCQARRPTVLLGFNMRQLSRLRHTMSFPAVYLYRERDRARAKGPSRTPAPGQQGAPRSTGPAKGSAAGHSGSCTEPVAPGAESGVEEREMGGAGSSRDRGTGVGELMEADPKEDGEGSGAGSSRDSGTGGLGELTDADPQEDGEREKTGVGCSRDNTTGVGELTDADPQEDGEREKSGVGCSRDNTTGVGGTDAGQMEASRTESGAAEGGEANGLGSDEAPWQGGENGYDLEGGEGPGSTPALGEDLDLGALESRDAAAEPVTTPPSEPAGLSAQQT